MAQFNTFDLGQVIANAEAIKGMRKRSITEDLQQQFLGQRIQAGEQAMAQNATKFSQDQQIENTRLLNAAMAEIAQDPSAADRWVPQLQQAGVVDPSFDWRSKAPEELQAHAKNIFDSTSKALSSYNQSGNAGGVQSTFQGANGNAWVMTRDGRAVDTGVAMQKFSPKTVDIGGGVSVFDPNVRGVTGQIATPGQQIGAAASLAGAQQSAKEGATTAAIPGQVSAKTQTERLSLHIDAGISAADSLPVINRALELLDSVKTGGIDAAKLAATNFLGVTGADESELSNNLGKAVLSQLRATFGAQFTEREGARLDALEANFGKSTEGNKRILQQVKKLVERAARRGIDAAERTGDKFSADEIRRSMDMKLSPQSQQGPARVNSDADYDALPSGAEFTAPDGTTRRKP